MKTVYLCGGINGLSDEDCTDWREATKAELYNHFNFLDPMRRDYRGREAECVKVRKRTDFYFCRTDCGGLSPFSSLLVRS